MRIETHHSTPASYIHVPPLLLSNWELKTKQTHTKKTLSLKHDVFMSRYTSVLAQEILQLLWSAATGRFPQLFKVWCLAILCTPKSLQHSEFLFSVISFKAKLGRVYSLVFKITFKAMGLKCYLSDSRTGKALCFRHIHLSHTSESFAMFNFVSF